MVLNSMSLATRHQGFTLIEILVVLVIISIITGISVATFVNMNRGAILREASSNVYDALTSARGRTLSSQNNTVYGVRMSTSSIIRFEGSTYTPGNTSNTVYLFNSAVSATSSLITQGKDIIFQRLNGEPSATGTVYIRNGISTSTIIIHGSGLVEYQ